jgi:hypothetical protein
MMNICVCIHNLWHVSQGQWQLAEAVFGELEDEALLAVDAANPPPNLNPASTPFGTAAGTHLL